MKALYKHLFGIWIACLMASTISASSLYAQLAKPQGDEVRPPLKNELPYLQTLLHKQNWALEVTSLLGPKGTITLRRPATVIMSAGLIAANLPYVGEISAPNLSKESMGVQFQNKYQNYSITNAPKNYIITFSVKEVGENYHLRLMVSPNGYSTLIVTSNARSDIRYMGNMRELPSPKEVEVAFPPASRLEEIEVNE